MSRGPRAFSTITASFALAMPVFAQAPAPTTAFDGKYAGVSREVSKTPSARRANNCPQSGVPGSLTITNGVARWRGGDGWEGTVSPSGVIVMRAPNGGRFDGQIDTQGAITGQIGGWGCTGTFVWRKQSG
jgi:hypothetical protein